MKRSWFGLGLLAFLLAASLTVTWAMDKIHEPVAQALYRAESLAQENWELATEAAFQAERDWEKWQHLRSCFADQTPVEEIDAQFARLESVSDGEDRGEFAALAAETAQMVQAMGDAHSLNWWSFF